MRCVPRCRRKSASWAQARASCTSRTCLTLGSRIAFHFNVFPGTSITILAEVFSLQRCEPHATDPNKCIYEHWHMALKPNDADLVPGPEGMVPFEEVEKRVVIYGEETLSDVADQDLERATGQQLGLSVTGIQGRLPVGSGESGAAIPQFH